jgi:hypothetical protein
MCQRTLGSVTVESVDDIGDLKKAPARGSNYTLRHNHHLAESNSEGNDPSTQLSTIRAGYTSLRNCTVLLNKSRNVAPAPQD